jgi:acyl-CoA reductase-like NAD-dependent aldehyde dehydrogenase
MYTYESLLEAIAPQGGEKREVFNPSTGELIGHAPVQTVADVDAAIARAEAAQPAWAALTDDERVSYLHQVADKIEENAEALAEVLSREQGKPMNGPNARFEVGGCVAWTRVPASTPLPVEVVVDDGENYAELHYRPLGVVGVITPWNWPMMISIWQMIPALRMGNTVVAKPSEHTTLSGLALNHIINSVLPEGVLNTVAGAGDLGARLVESDRVDKIMFTGSTHTGKKIIESSSGNVKRLTLELGGNDAGIVLDDADPKAIAEGLFWGAFINTGQTCAALKRLYVPDSLYDEVVDALAEVAENMPMGDGRDEQNVLGPLQNEMQYRVVDRLVESAKSSGARVVLGGNPDHDAPGYTDLDDAIRMANSLDVGLGGSVWSADRDRAREVAARIEAGTVWINQHGTVNPFIPFGGAKQSGYGLEFGVHGLKAVAQPQVISG